MIRVGISACLLGQPVRWDGGHKHARSLVSELGRYLEWVPVCPEVEVGMGVPRPSLRLVRAGGELRMVENQGGRDHTQAMHAFARQRAAALIGADLCGFVLKARSPSCGPDGVEVFGSGGGSARDGRGLFAQALLEAMPWLPVEDEGRLADASVRADFLERVFACRRRRDREERR